MPWSATHCVVGLLQGTERNIYVFLVQLVLGGVGVGLAFGLLTLYWMSLVSRKYAHADVTIQVALTLVMSYACFYVAEGALARTLARSLTRVRACAPLRHIRAALPVTASRPALPLPAKKAACAPTALRCAHADRGHRRARALSAPPRVRSCALS